MAELLLDGWKNAKDEFEETTGLKKPTAKGGALFITWRKSSGLEDAFKKLDQCGETVNDKSDAKFFKSWQAAVADMTKKKEAQLKLMDDAIAEEKNSAGKSDNYRAFKVFKASLEAIASRGEQKYKDWADKRILMQQSGKQILDKFEVVLHTLRMLGTNLKSATAKATLFCKEVLADPKPASYNDGILTAARDMRQSITNIKRYVYADKAELLIKGTAKELEEIALLEDDKIFAQLRKMSLALGSLEDVINKMGTPTGTTPTDSSLDKLGTKPVKFANNATANEVKAGIKHLAVQIKACTEISSVLLRYA
jgi:hypothetical protein